MRLVVFLLVGAIVFAACGSGPPIVDVTAEPESVSPTDTGETEETTTSKSTVVSDNTLPQDTPAVTTTSSSDDIASTTSTTAAKEGSSTSSETTVKPDDEAPTGLPFELFDLTAVESFPNFPGSCISPNAIGETIHEPVDLIEYLDEEPWVEVHLSSYTFTSSETLTGADVDGDGTIDFVQNFILESDDLPGSSVQGTRVCGTGMAVEDFVQIGANKPSSVQSYTSGMTRDMLLSRTATGTGGLLTLMTVSGGVLQLTEDFYEISVTG